MPKKLLPLLYSLSRVDKIAITTYLNCNANKMKAHLSLYNFAIEYINELQKEEGQNGVTSFDEKTIKGKWLREEYNENAYARTKKALYDRILEVLRTQKALQKNSMSMKITSYLQDVTPLKNRGLGAQALKRIKEAKEIAKEYEYEVLMLEALLIEKKLIRSFVKMPEKERKRCLKDNSDLTKEYLLKVSYMNKVLDIYDLCFFAYHKNKHPDLEKWLQRLKNISPEKLSIYTQVMYYSALSRIYHLMSNMEESAKVLKLLLLNMESASPSLKGRHRERYVDTYANYLIRCLILRNSEEYKAGIKELKNLKGKTLEKDKQYRMSLFMAIYPNELQRLSSEGEYGEAVKVVDEYEKDFLEFESRIPAIELIIILFYQNFCCFFNYISIKPLNEQSKSGLRKIYRNITERLLVLIQQKDTRPDIKMLVFMLQIAVSIEYDQLNNEKVERVRKNIDQPYKELKQIEINQLYKDAIQSFLDETDKLFSETDKKNQLSSSTHRSPSLEQLFHKNTELKTFINWAKNTL